MKKRIALLLLAALLLGLTACGSRNPQTQGKVLRLAVDFAYPSLDAHKEYYGWFTSIYGVTEALFRMGDDSSVQPALAEKAETGGDGLTWTVTLRDGVCFSNGVPMTAEMAVRNLRRAAEVNSRFAYLAAYDMTAVDEKTLTITTPEVYPTLLNELASPELAILDLDASADLDTAPVATGPFVIKSFQPEGTVEVSRNQHYWGGEVKLDGAVFYYMQEDEPKLMAMQNDEIDAYTSVTAAAREIYQADPDRYQLTDVPATRLQFYILNQETLDDAVRAAVNLTVAYYPARSLDSIALLMQEQLKAVGIGVTFNCQEDPDATYIANRDFDIALYCMIADKNGDPYYFIDSTLRRGGYFDVGGFDSHRCQQLIDRLQYEIDGSQRAELANQIVQLAIDDNAFGYVGLFNKTTVARKGVVHIAESCPFDFYFISAGTDIIG